MLRQRARQEAFTLVELLAVIAILTLLVSMLLPVLSSARAIALRAQCLGNQRNIAAAILGFAAEHQGRAPGIFWNGRNETPYGWPRILNVEYFKVSTIGPATSGVYEGMVKDPMPKGALTCPSAKKYGSWGGVYPYQLNDDVDGGDGPLESQYWYPSPAEYDANYSHDYKYSKPVDPSFVQPLYSPNGDIVNWYNLGTRLLDFPRPDYTYMMTEGEYPCMGDWGWINWPTNSSPPTLLNAQPSGYLADPTIPPWAGDNTKMSTFYGFRHTLPPDYASYQARATACFTFVDGHVDSMNANVTDQNQYYRLRLK